MTAILQSVPAVVSLGVFTAVLLLTLLCALLVRLFRHLEGELCRPTPRFNRPSLESLEYRLAPSADISSVLGLHEGVVGHGRQTYPTPLGDMLVGNIDLASTLEIVNGALRVDGGARQFSVRFEK